MRQRPSQLRRLAPCVALTVAAHAAVLALPMRPASARGDGQPIAALQVLTIVRQPTAPQAPQSTPPEQHGSAAALPEQQGSAAAPSPQLLAPAPPVHGSAAPLAPKVSAAAPAPHVPSARVAVALPPPADDEPPVARSESGGPATLPGWGLPSAAHEDDAFLARSLLTLAPQPLAPVIIPTPEFVGPGELYRGELTLFIDDTGAVVRVRAETDDLPVALEDTARRAFMAVRFAPGELTDLGAVKSRIRVEVVFEGGSPQS